MTLTSADLTRAAHAVHELASQVREGRHPGEGVRPAADLYSLAVRLLDAADALEEKT